MSRGEQTGEGNGGDAHFGRDLVDFSGSSNKGSWLVSYADMMTILLAFMIMLLSVSKIAHTKFDLLVEALTGRKVGNLHKVKEKIDQVVEKASLGGQVTTSIDEDGLKVQFANALLFPSGKAQLTDEAVEVFRPIADHLVRDLEPAYGVTIEGYTDDVPIENGTFDSNWELSASRAIHVMKRLAKEGFDRRRMSVQGHADTRAATDVPLWDDNKLEQLPDEKLEEIRAKNRRVVIRINRLDRDVVRDIVGGNRSGSATTGTNGKRAPPTQTTGNTDAGTDGGGGSGGFFDRTQESDETSEDTQ